MAYNLEASVSPESLKGLEGSDLEADLRRKWGLDLYEIKTAYWKLQDWISSKEQSITSLLVEKEEKILAVSGRLEASVGEVKRYRGLVEDLHKEMAQRETNALQDLNTITGDYEALQKEYTTVQDKLQEREGLLKEVKSSTKQMDKKYRLAQKEVHQDLLRSKDLLVEKEEEILAVSGRLEASVGEVERYRGLVEDLHKEIAQRETNALQDLNTVTGDGEALQECATVQDMVSRGPRAEGLRVQRSRAQLSQLEQREELQTGRDGADQREQLSARCSALEAQLAAAHLEVAVEQDRTQQHRVRCSALLSQLERRYGNAYFQLQQSKSELSQQWAELQAARDGADQLSARWTAAEIRLADTHLQREESRVKLQQEREGEIAGRDEFNAYGAEIRELRQEVGGSREMAAEAKEEVARLKTSLTSAQKGHLRRRRSSRTRSSRR